MIENRFAQGQSMCFSGEGDSVLWSDVSPCVVCSSETTDSSLSWLVTCSLDPVGLCSDWLSVTVVLSVSSTCPVLSFPADFTGSPSGKSSEQVVSSPTFPFFRPGDFCRLGSAAFSSSGSSMAACWRRESSWTDTARRWGEGFMRGRGIGRVSSVTDCALSARSRISVLRILRGEGAGGVSLRGDGVGGSFSFSWG